MRMNKATPEEANAALRAYCEKLAPDAIIDPEFERRLGDADLVEHLIWMRHENSSCPMLADLYPSGPITIEQARAEWEALPEVEKRMEQVSFVAPPFCYF